MKQMKQMKAIVVKPFTVETRSHAFGELFDSSVDDQPVSGITFAIGDEVPTEILTRHGDYLLEQGYIERTPL